MIKDMYDIDIYCSCMECKTVHTVQVCEENGIDVHYAKCDICGNIADYTKDEIYSMNKGCLYCDNVIELDDGSLMCTEHNKQVSEEYCCLYYKN